MLARLHRIRHRGPDWSGVEVVGNNILCHERLAIVDPGCLEFSFGRGAGEAINHLSESGAQPLKTVEEKLTLTVNGEIYNHQSLRAALEKKHVFRTHSDCEVILHLVCAPDCDWYHFY